MWSNNVTAWVDRLWSPLNGFHEQISLVFITVTFELCMPMFLALKGHSPRHVKKCTQAMFVWGFEGKNKGLAENVAVKEKKGRVQDRISK